MDSKPLLQLPISATASDWLTVSYARTVLAVVHNVTALTRLIDVLDVLESDSRVQVVFTVTGSSPFDHGIEERLAALGCIVISWHQACETRFDVAISASNGGELQDLNAPIVIVPHGMGYNKYLQRSVFGLAPEWLLHDGSLIPSALVLSHDEQLARLRGYCPEAVDVATVAGDPCLDRLRASLHLRDRYRRAFGLTPGRRLVVLTSTWGPNSLYGRHPELPRRFAAELPIDRYSIAVVLHPNVWHAHAPWQIRSWLAECRDAGVTVVPAWEAWRPALIAADVVVGDHGSVTMYAAAIARPVLVAAADPEGVDPASPIARFTAAAPVLELGKPLAGQLEAAVTQSDRVPYADVISEVTSEPGRAAALLRTLLYHQLKLGEPAHSAVTAVVPVPVPADLTVVATTAVVVRTELAGAPAGTVRMKRYPAALRLTDPPPGDSHLLVEWTHRDAGLLTLADVLICRPEDTFDAPEVWIRQTLHDYPGCLIAVVAKTNSACFLAVRNEPMMELRSETGSGTPAVLASAVYGWLAAGRRLDAVDGVLVDCGDDVRIRMRAAPEGASRVVQPRSSPAECLAADTR